MPPNNPFIPKSFDLINMDRQAKEPIKVHKGKFIDTWYKPDTKFMKPKTIVHYKFYSDDHGFGKVLKAHLLLEIWLSLL